MASREEEKRRRREERLAAEEQMRAHARRQRLLQYGLGGLLVIAVVIGIVIAGTGGSDASGPVAAKSPGDGAAVPGPSQRNLQVAAKSAGCVLRNPSISGAQHTSSPGTYNTNPPTSGPHNPVPALDGIYAPGQEPTAAQALHTLEHGRVTVQYARGTPPALVSQLETLVSEPINGKQGYKTLLFQNDTKMPYAVAATAWGRLLGCKTVDKPAIFDAVRDFRTKYVDKGPEQGIPPTN